MALEIGLEVAGAETPTLEVIRTQAGTPAPVTIGMPVCGADGDRVGALKEVRAADLLVDRPLQRDVYVPFEAVQTVREDEIVLTVPAAEVDGQRWPHPPLLPF